ncbi:MAG: gluconokinase, partial [Janibacter sp.]|nr:gluconokinase [Janibacter sp.]
MTTHVVVMGVSGSGKTTVALGIVDRTGWVFAEADEFHPQANIDKMASGTPLTDEDRWPWL